MTGLVTTFQLRLPRGPHEAILDRFAELFGSAERRLHRELANLPLAATVGADAARDAKNAIKRKMIAEAGLTARHYNSVLNSLEGRHDSLRELAKARVATMQRKLKRLEKKMAPRQKSIEAYAKACDELAERRAQGKAPTKALLAKLEKGEAAAKDRFILHQQKRRRQMLADRIARERRDLERAVPKLVFGSKGILQQRALLHANDAVGLQAWRRKWELSRGRKILLVGSSDESAGCQSCVATLVDEGAISLRLRLPDPLCAEGKYLHISDVSLPEYAREAVMDALRRHAAPGGRGPAFTWRFSKDLERAGAKRLSAWRVNLTLTVPAAEVITPSFETRGTGKHPQSPVALTDMFRGAIGVDLNADHIAFAMIDRYGNPVRSDATGLPTTGRIELPLRGASSDRRNALIGDAARDLVDLAVRLQLPLVMEQLDFTARKEALKPGDASYNRMLSSFAWSQIQSAIRRRAARLGVELVDVNPAWTSMIGKTNYARRYGLSVHIAAAVAIARRAAQHSERINYIHGLRGRRNTLLSRSESRRHVWRHWSIVKAATEVQWVKRRHVAGSAPSAAPMKRVQMRGQLADARSGQISSG